MVDADLRSTDAVESMVATIADELGPVAVLVNAASAYRAEPVVEIDRRQLGHDDRRHALIDLPRVARRRPWHASRRLGTHRELCVAFGRSRGSPSAPHYAAAKAGVIGLTSSLAKELGPDGILVNAVAPTQILTIKDGMPSIPEERAEKLSRSIPLRRLATPDDIAGLVVWLASGANTYLTGETISFTGGAKT